MRKIRNILLGWWYMITNHNDRMARERLKVCVKCPYRKGLFCSECGCVLNAKARIDQEDCPKKLWPL